MADEIRNLAPDRFGFWTPPPGCTVAVGPERTPCPLPDSPLPLHLEELQGDRPSDAAIGQGVYDYLRQFPDCAGNAVYAQLLGDAYPHFIADLAAHAVMLDAKAVEPAYVLRKLTCLKILALLDPCNPALLAQLCRGYFELALDLAELSRCRRHLRDAMRYGQELLAVVPDDPQGLALLAEIDLLFGDSPAAVAKWRRLAERLADAQLQAQVAARIAACSGDECPDTALVDDLEQFAEAMHLHSAGDHRQAVALLERLEEQGRLTTVLPSADFYWLLGASRAGIGDTGGAVRALHRCLELEPDHAAALTALGSL